MLLPMPSCSERLSVQFLHDFACAGCSRSDVNNCVGMHQNGMLEKRVLGGTQLRCPLNSAHHNLCSLQISPHRLENSYVQEQPPHPPKLTAVAYRKCPLPRPSGFPFSVLRGAQSGHQQCVAPRLRTRPAYNAKGQGARRPHPHPPPHPSPL